MLCIASILFVTCVKVVMKSSHFQASFLARYRGYFSSLTAQFRLASWSIWLGSKA